MRIVEQLSDWEFDLRRSHDGKPFFRKIVLRLLNVEFAAPFTMGRDIYIHQSGRLRIGARFGLGSFARIWNYAEVDIGDDFLAAGGLTINTGSHDPDSLRPSSAPVRIGHRVWCGVNVTILGGVTIGNDVVIGAGSVVTRDIPPGVVAAGVPCRVIRKLCRTEIWRWIDGGMHLVTAEGAPCSEGNGSLDDGSLRD